MRIGVGLLGLALLVGSTAGPAVAAGPIAADPVVARDAAWEHVVSDSFGSYAALESEWNYGYPWGSDHNGTARMYGSPTDHGHVWLDGGVLNLKATRIDWDEGNSGADPFLPIRYHSGAVHAKDHIVVNDRDPTYEVRGEFQAPSTRGTWPAFWLTGVNSRPPESDILEFKGDSRNWFNTFRSPTDVSTTIVDVAEPGSWHEYRAWIAKVDDTDVDIHYYLDGRWVAQHRAADFVNQSLWVITNHPDGGFLGFARPRRRHPLSRPRRLHRPEHRLSVGGPSRSVGGRGPAARRLGPTSSMPVSATAPRGRRPDRRTRTRGTRMTVLCGDTRRNRARRHRDGRTRRQEAGRHGGRRMTDVRRGRSGGPLRCPDDGRHPGRPIG
ncbi:hypothetical protein FHR81_001854 [Actinoalloteichus hoggarensis]|uniref:Uncharacterized protein n=1 Tax=Actinoalloteichus hoggarensis TaxID=1470176 RepID=A0A221W4V0_9PSEU|nr:hypothetical protein [Actinoalloteichus hoggarensis]ASO20885.1 hypothetical protein AHOG_16295 [Actinoalloteichus hoggarensis]MBB5920816.1 hypothetical protein [Actinoalloteichus hoggarensis]